jgi:tRNA(fMet)-specific endonuclease VapC
MICLDTNAVIAAIKSANSVLRARIDRVIHERTPVALPCIVLFELRYGIAKSARQERNTKALEDFLAGPVQLLDFDADDAREAGDIRAALERAGTPIGAYDLLIAAQARRRNATLVSANVREFSRVPGLRFEDWAA